MDLQDHIRDVRTGLKTHVFASEAAVSQGVVLRLLRALGWPTDDVTVVAPQYAVANRRVDFALCTHPGKPLVFVEVKKVGESKDADRQLFEYAFHQGVPMAILTDGREWHFYLPGEQGDYQERRVYLLDLLERSDDQIEDRLRRYLDYDASRSKHTIEDAKQDYRNVDRKRQIDQSLPRAIRELISEHDEGLLKIVADKVESLCGYRPESEEVSAHLATYLEPARDLQEQPTSPFDHKREPKQEVVTEKVLGPSPKAAGKSRREAFVSSLREEGIHLKQDKGQLYRTATARLVGIATATEIKNKWFLGLPMRPYDCVVLLCETGEKRQLSFVISTANNPKLLEGLSRSGDHYKLNVCPDGHQYYLTLPRLDDRMEITPFLGQTRLLR